MRFAAFLFAVTLANAGQFTTSLGDTYPYTISAIATDSAGNTYVTGNRQLTPPSSIQTDVFVTKLDPSGNLLFTRVFGGSASSTASAIALDPTGNIYIAGGTTASDFPLSKALQTQSNASGTGFILKLTNDGTTILYSTYLGGTLARISAAEVVSIYGPGIGPAVAMNAAPVNGFYPSTLSGIQVTMNGTNIPLLYVSANQINAVVPMKAAVGAGATIHVINGSSVTPAFPVWIDASDSEAFPTVLNQDGTINSQTNPAALNSVVTFYATGWQSSFGFYTDGQVASSALTICEPPIPGVSGCQVVAPYTSPIGVITYAGTAPGIVVGVTQLNMLLSTGGATVSPSNNVEPYSFSITDATYGPVTQTVWVKL